MTLKLELASLEGLEDPIAALYEKAGDNRYRLRVEGVEDVSGLKAKVAELLEEAKDSKRRAKEAEDAVRLSADEAVRREQGWQQKLSQRETELTGERDALHATVRELTVNATAARIAQELAVPGSAEALLPHITARLALETVEGKPQLRVLGRDGQPSALSVAELSTEIAGTAAFAPLIVASRATGGGAGGGQQGGRAAQTRRASEMDAGEKAAYIARHGIGKWQEKLRTDYAPESLARPLATPAGKSH